MTDVRDPERDERDSDAPTDEERGGASGEIAVPVVPAASSPDDTRDRSTDYLWHPRTKRYFHMALVAVPLLFLCVPVVLGLALVATFDPESHPERRLWLRWLYAVAAIDVLLVVGLAFTLPGYAAVLTGDTDEMTLSAPVMRHDTSGPRIGVRLDRSYDEGARLTGIVPDSPAARAGLAVDDVVVAIDDLSVTGPEALQEAIASEPVGEARRFEIVRGDERLEVLVTPAEHIEAEVGLFEAYPGSKCDPGGWEGGEAAFLAVVFPMWLLVGVWSQKPRRWGFHVWPPLIAILFFSMALAPLIAAYTACSLRGGAAAIDGVMALHAQMIAMLGLGGLWLLYIQRRESLELRGGPPIRDGAVFVLALIYLLGSLARIGAAVFIMASLGADEPTVPGEGLVEDFITSTVEHGWIGTGLLLLAVAVIGPIAEEVMFRGVLLPWASKHIPVTAAIVLTSAFFALLHFHYGLRMLGIFAIGVVLGWARYRTGGLKVPILLHITINATSSIGVLVN